jgi:phage terminase large subunit
MSIGLDIPTPRAFVPLLPPSRYKGAHGGRGSGKSHFFAELLVEHCVLNPGTRAVCIREIQKSLAQSAKRTLELYIEKHGVGHLFDVQKAEIKTPGDGLIIFQGMQNHTAESIKSLEGYDIAWVEEAQTLSATSLRLLRPTMRKRGSELWFSWNPRKPDDPVDALLRCNSDDARKNDWQPPPNSIVVEVNYPNNPWFFTDSELVDEMKFDKRDPDTFQHVWMGGYESKSEARVFKNWRIEEFEPPAGHEQFYLGADWGFSPDPTVLVLCYVIGRTLYIWREIWAVECTLDRIPALFDKIDPNWTPQRAIDPNWKSLARKLPIIGDSSRNDTIAYLKKSGFPKIQGAIKGPGSLEDGIEFLRGYDMVIHPQCKRVAQECRLYSHKVDRKTGKVTSELEDKENHTIDSVRYALENVRRGKGETHVSRMPF